MNKRKRIFIPELAGIKFKILEKISLMENGFKDEEKMTLQIAFLVMDKSGFK